MQGGFGSTTGTDAIFVGDQMHGGIRSTTGMKALSAAAITSRKKTLL